MRLDVELLVVLLYNKLGLKSGNIMEVFLRKFTVVFISILLSFGFVYADAKSIDIFIDGQKFKTKLSPIANDGHTLVAARPFLEALGYKVTWEGQTRTIVATAEHNIKLTINNQLAFFDQQEINLKSKPIILDNHSYIPLRDVAEALSANVKWKADARRIEVVSAKNNSLAAYGVPTHLSELKELYGEPERITTSIYGFDWHTYHNNYKDFVMYGVRDNSNIVAVYTKNPRLIGKLKLKRGQTYKSAKAKFGKSLDSITKNGTRYILDNPNQKMFALKDSYMRLFLDELSERRLTAVMLTTKREELLLDGYYGNNHQLKQQDFEVQLFDLANADRVNNGLDPFLWHEGIVAVARRHSEDMKDNSYFDHIDLNGNNIADRLRQSGYKGVYSAENIAAGQVSSIFAHEDLMNSARHRAVILGPASFMATGIAFGGEHHNYYTEAFFTPVQ